MRRILAVILLFMCASALASAQSGDASRQKLKQGDKGAGKPGANAAKRHRSPSPIRTLRS